MSTALIYRIRIPAPETHRFSIEIEIPALTTGPCVLAMPAWTPGSYMIRDFARNLSRVEAWTLDGQPIALAKTDKQTWICDVSATPFLVRYEVYAWELSVRTSHLDRTHAHLNGASLFLRVGGFDDQPCLLDLIPPDDATCASWRVATSLQPLDLDARGFGRYRADDYDDLIDHPIEMGCFEEIAFEVGSVPHRMTISGRHRADRQRLASDLARVCAEHAALFGELPVDRYLFLLSALGEGYGGLEHRFSTALICARDDLPRVGEETPSEGYVRLLGLCSHEYFHLWHVRRIRPRVLQESRLDREAHTRTLWAFEGITSYYDDLALVRSGCIDVPTYLGLLAGTITRLMRALGREIQTLAESSFDAWTKLYKQDEDAPNAIVSYYVKGALVALALDLTLRRGTAGRVSLDDLMRDLWTRHGRTGLGVEERGIEEAARRVSGLDLDAFFDRALDGTEDLDLADLLADVGIGLRLRPTTGPKDTGGCVTRFEPIVARPSLDVRLRPGGGEAVVQNVIRGGAGERAGLAPGDVIVAVDGLRASAENLESLIARAAASDGAAVSLHLFRRDELMRVEARPLPARADTCELMLLDTVAESVVAARAHWLAGHT